jgi:U3 small nucleolar RNA-associated protein 20
MYKLISYILVAQLKVNLRPLVGSNHEGACPNSRFDAAKLFGLAVFEDLRQISEGRSLELSPGWAKESLSDDNDGDDIHEEERAWQDPSAHKLRVAVSSWTSDRVPQAEDR